MYSSFRGLSPLSSGDQGTRRWQNSSRSTSSKQRIKPKEPQSKAQNQQKTEHRKTSSVVERLDRQATQSRGLPWWTGQDGGNSWRNPRPRGQDKQSLSMKDLNGLRQELNPGRATTVLDVNPIRVYHPTGFLESCYCWLGQNHTTETAVLQLHEAVSEHVM